MDVNTAWKREFQAGLQLFLAALGQKVPKKWAPLDVLGLLAPLARKSIRPMAQQLAPARGGNSIPLSQQGDGTQLR